MRGQLANVITVQTGSLANIRSIDLLTDEEREQVERLLDSNDSEPTRTSCPETTAPAVRLGRRRS